MGGFKKIKKLTDFIAVVPTTGINPLLPLSHIYAEKEKKLTYTAHEVKKEKNHKECNCVIGCVYCMPPFHLSV